MRSRLFFCLPCTARQYHRSLKISAGRIFPGYFRENLDKRGKKTYHIE